MWKYAHTNGQRGTFSNAEALKKHLPAPCGKELLLDFDIAYSKTKLIQKARTWGGQVWSRGNDSTPLFEITCDGVFITPEFNQ